jgi:hypothetical protein
MGDTCDYEGDKGHHYAYTQTYRKERKNELATKSFRHVIQEHEESTRKCQETLMTLAFAS